MMNKPDRAIPIGLALALLGYSGLASAQIPLPKIIVDPAKAQAGLMV